MLPSAGSKGKPMITPSICRNITLLKLNSTDIRFSCCLHVLNKIIKQKRWSDKVTAIKGGSTNINSLCQGTLVKRLDITKQLRKAERGNSNCPITLAKLKKS